MQRVRRFTILNGDYNMIKKMLKKTAKFSEKKPFLMVFIIIVITIFAGISATNVKSQTAFDKMLPQDDPVIISFNEVKDEFGGGNVVIMAIKLKDSDKIDKVDDIRDPRVFELVKYIKDTFEDSDYITSVSASTDKIINNNNGIIPNDIATVKEIYDNLPKEDRNKIYNRDFSMIILNLESDSGDSRAIMKEVFDKLDGAPVPDGIEVIPTGSPAMGDLMGKLMGKSQAYTTGLGLIGVLIVLFLYFRRPLSATMPLIPILISVVWTGGAMGLFGIPLDMATAGMGSLLLGMGIDYGIHLMHRYEEERKNGKNIGDAIEIAVVSTGSAVFATTATTIAGFTALTFAPLPMMANLGKVCALGIFFCMVAVMTLLPALLIIEEKYILPAIRKMASTD